MEKVCSLFQTRSGGVDRCADHELLILKIRGKLKTSIKTIIMQKHNLKDIPKEFKNYVRIRFALLISVVHKLVEL